MARARILNGIRDFFSARGFLEVETPIRVINPGLEPHLHAIAAGEGLWLRTSPELALKRLIAAGLAPLFEIARCFRGDEEGPWHRSEFTMLEWYRTQVGLDAIATDVAELLPALAHCAGVDATAVCGTDLTAPIERVTVREAVRQQTGLDLAMLRERAALATALRERGYQPADDDDWDDLFFRLFLAEVEPQLGRSRITILSEYPASQAALARVRDDADWPIALRFEVYAGGLELANAFDELTDSAEQRRRHVADQATRRRAGREVPALDEEFLAALERGLPQCAGIALGIDRLIALLLGAKSIRDVGI